MRMSNILDVHEATSVYHSQSLDSNGSQAYKRMTRIRELETLRTFFSMWILKGAVYSKVILHVHEATSLSQPLKSVIKRIRRGRVGLLWSLSSFSWAHSTAGEHEPVLAPPCLGVTWGAPCSLALSRTWFQRTKLRGDQRLRTLEKSPQSQSVDKVYELVSVIDWLNKLGCNMTFQTSFNLIKHTKYHNYYKVLYIF